LGSWSSSTIAGLLWLWLWLLRLRLLWLLRLLLLLLLGRSSCRDGCLLCT
jgi:hypothetical protein